MLSDRYNKYTCEDLLKKVNERLELAGYPTIGGDQSDYERYIKSGKRVIQLDIQALQESPFSITKIDDQKARVAWGGHFDPKSFETDASILKEYYQYIKEKYLYKLVSSYDDHSFDNLPDLGGPWVKLDGSAWHFEAKFADGTYISVGGNETEGENLRTLQVMLEDLIKKHIGTNE